jgi:non-lysosomal glucosylceramidase
MRILFLSFILFFICACNRDKENLPSPVPVNISSNPVWPVLKYYDQQHLYRIAMPLGGIGTGTVSLGGRGNLCDWEIMNRPSKGFMPTGQAAPFFCLYTVTASGEKMVKVLEGQLEPEEFEGSHGSGSPNAGLPRFRDCSFAVAYPLAQVFLSDPQVPLDIRMEAFNPMVPCDEETSGLPIAVIRYVLKNNTNTSIAATVCGNIPNFIGNDGFEKQRNWCGDLGPVGENKNTNHFVENGQAQGIVMQSDGVDPHAEQWGTMALMTRTGDSVSYRAGWPDHGWNTGLLDFWEDLADDGALVSSESTGINNPMASLAVHKVIPPHTIDTVTFLLAWHFPNRFTWSKHGIETTCCGPAANEGDGIGNYYTTRFSDALDVANKIYPQLAELEKLTLGFVRSFSNSDLPAEIKEAALFNLSTLRSQTCFRTPDGRFFGYEGTCNQQGCCNGSCTHVWNYEQATAFLYGILAKSMREVEFAHATDNRGLMSFRVNLPLKYANEFNRAAADGQMGCIMKMYRDWQLSGDDALLKSLWPGVKRALSFCWIKGGWDANIDGVMEGCQHNTMDVEYYGPNPEMEFWYLGALRAAGEMALYLGDKSFADSCKILFTEGKTWTDQNLFNGSYYIHLIEPPKHMSDVAEGLRVGMGATDVFNPDFQLGKGCLVDQLVGQTMAHICGLGYLADSGNVKKTLSSILQNNYYSSVGNRFNNMRSYAMGDEPGLLVASYPGDRPLRPFPYFDEVWTGLEYTAAAGMLFEDMAEDALKTIRDVRNRFDGLKRNPFDEAECGHHYARAMASWAAIPASTGFHYSGVSKTMTFGAKAGTYFWSNGYAWGNCTLKKNGKRILVQLEVLGGELKLESLVVKGIGQKIMEKGQIKCKGESITIEI